jgi:fucose 4-O-acetylase-like acetyltransferase
MSAEGQLVETESSVSPQPKNRDRAVDIARGLAVLLVVLGHADPPMLLANFTYGFRLPLFFFISGSFLKPRSTREAFGRFAWLMSSIIFYGVLLASIAVFTTKDTEWLIAFQRQWRDVLELRAMAFFIIPSFGTFWFLVALAVMRLVSEVLKKGSVFVGLVLFFSATYLNWWSGDKVFLHIGRLQEAGTGTLFSSSVCGSLACLCGAGFVRSQLVGWFQ